MKIIKAPFGVFLLKNGELKHKEVFKKPEKATSYFLEGEIQEKVSVLKEEYSEAEVESPTDYLEIGRKLLGEDMNEYLNKFFRELSRKLIKKGFSEDLIIKQAVRSLEDLEGISNRIFERAKEWFNLYYPEAADKLPKMEEFFAEIRTLDREELSSQLGLSEISMGAEFSEVDKKVLLKLINTGRKTIKMKEEIEEYLESKMEKVAPNLSKIAGPKIGAELISISGSLKKLAKEPASTIQVLGAEEALFEHLKKGTPSPKYGILFNHPMVKAVKKENKGKMARTLASKLAIAARTDYYSDKEVWEKLKEDLKERRDSLC